MKNRTGNLFGQIILWLLILLPSFSLFHSNQLNGEKIGNRAKKQWKMYVNPEEAGFAREKLNKIKQYYYKNNLASLFVVYKSKVLIALGDYQRRYLIHSIRKSLINAIFGYYVERNKINIKKDLHSLSINDINPLSNIEKDATIAHLLQARSGIYHPSVFETKSMKSSKPGRFKYKPGTHWHYNNWDFNCLSTVFYKETGIDMLDAFSEKIAKKINMEDFRPIDYHYYSNPKISQHQAWAFKLSTRDLARFGLLYLQKGKWNKKNIISGKWIKESLKPYSNTGTNRGGYGYLWWLPELKGSAKSFAAFGVGTQMLLISKNPDVIIVQRVNTYRNKRHPFNKKFCEMIIQTCKGIEVKNAKTKVLPEIKKKYNFIIPKNKTYNGEYRGIDGSYKIKNYLEGLMISYPKGLKARLIALGNNKFLVEDLHEIIILNKTKKNKKGQIRILGIED